MNPTNETSMIESTTGDSPVVDSTTTNLDTLLETKKVYSLEDDPWYIRFGNSIKHFFKKCKRFFFGYGKYTVKTGLKDEWWDADTRILYANMQILKEFVEEEMHIVDWEDTTEVRNAKEVIARIYAWWCNYDNRKKEIKKALDDWHVAFMAGIDSENSEGMLLALNRGMTEDERAKNKILHELESKLLAEEESMLIDLMKIRNYLWT